MKLHRAIPVYENAGNRVSAGAVNGAGGFVVRAERVGSDTLLGQIVNMVAEAHSAVRQGAQRDAVETHRK